MEKPQTERTNIESSSLLVSKKQRYLYAFLFCVPSIFVAIFVYALAFLFIMIFAFFTNTNDKFSTWVNYSSTPTLIENILLILPLIVIFLGIALGYSIGKKRDIKNVPINRNHIILSIVVTLILLFLFLFFRGNL